MRSRSLPARTTSVAAGLALAALGGCGHGEAGSAGTTTSAKPYAAPPNVGGYRFASTPIAILGAARGTSPNPSARLAFRLSRALPAGATVAVNGVAVPGAVRTIAPRCYAIDDVDGFDGGKTATAATQVVLTVSAGTGLRLSGRAAVLSGVPQRVVPRGC